MAGRQLIGNAVLASGTEVKLVPATILSENVYFWKETPRKLEGEEGIRGLCVVNFILKMFWLIQLRKLSKQPDVVILYYTGRGGRKE